MEEYRILDGSPAHVEALEELERLCFSVPWTREQLLAQFPDERHVFLVAEYEGAAVAYVGLMHVLDEGYISNVAVHPAHRCKGLADRLLKTLMERAERLELAFVTLEVRASNQAAIALYHNNGFVPVGQRKNYYDLPREDAILMSRFLK